MTQVSTRDFDQLVRGTVFILTDSLLVAAFEQGEGLGLEETSPGHGTGSPYDDLTRMVKASLENAPPVSVSLLDLSGLELFHAERFAGAIRAGLRQACPEPVQPSPLPDLSPDERRMLWRLGGDLRPDGTRERRRVPQWERWDDPCTAAARRIEELRSIERPSWSEGERFVALAWHAMTARQRFARDAFFTAWNWLDTQESAAERIALPLVLDRRVSVLGPARARLSPHQLEVLAQKLSLTFQDLAERELTRAYAKALGKLMTLCARWGLVTPRRYLTQDDPQVPLPLAPGRMLREHTSRPRLWRSVVGAAAAHFS